MENKKYVEIARSFSYKHNIGNYQSVDFFCSQKAECLPEEAEKKSEELYLFCKNEVTRALRDYKRLEKLQEQEEPQEVVWKPHVPTKQGQDPNEEKEVLMNRIYDEKKEG